MNIKYLLINLLSLLLLSCSNDENTPTPVEAEQDLPENSEPTDETSDDIFTNTEATDWFFYHNEDTSPEMKIRSVMASRDSSLILEAYSDSDDYTSSILFKQADKKMSGMFKIKNESPEEFFLIDNEISTEPNFSVVMKEGYSELYYHVGGSDGNGQKLLLFRFTLSLVDGDVEINEVESIESAKFDNGLVNECDSDLSPYQGEELCLALARKYWCERHANWKNKIPAFILAGSAKRVPVIRNFDLVRGRIGAALKLLKLQDDVQELLEDQVGETLSLYLSGINSMGQTFNSFIFKDIIKDGIVNGYCDTYKFRLNDSDYLIFTEPIAPTEIVTFVYPIDYSNDVELILDGDPNIVGWPGEALSNSFRVRLVAKDGIDVPSSFQTPIAWNIGNPKKTIGENYAFSQISLNQTSTYRPKVPDSPGDYLVTAYLTGDNDSRIDFTLRVTEEEIVVLVHSVNPYGAYEFSDRFPEIHTLEVSASVYANKGWGTIASVYLQVDNWPCCPNNSFGLGQFSGFNTVGEVTSASKHVSLDFKGSFGETNGVPVTLGKICARVSINSFEEYCAP